MTTIQEILDTFDEHGIELSKLELKNITKFIELNESENAFQEISYTFFIEPKPAKRPRTGTNGFYDPDQSEKKKFTKFVLSEIGYCDAFVKEWMKHSTRSRKKKGVDEEDREESKNFIKDNCLFLGQCKVVLDMYLPIPKNTANFKKKLAYIGYIRPEHKPDIDNYEKFIYDSINSIFYLDDGQIVANENNLFYTEPGNERVELTIMYRPQPLI